MNNPDLGRALHEITVAELAELIGIHELRIGQNAIRHQLTRILTRQEKMMTALEDLQTAVPELAAAVTDLTGAVDRIDADFAALEDVVSSGADPAAIEAEVAKIRETIDAAKTAKANIDSTDPAAAAPEPAPGEPGAGGGA